MAKAKMTTYELNKQGYNNLEPMTKDAIQEKKEELESWFEAAKSPNFYAGLLCRELNDYTVLRTNGKFHATVKEIIEVLQTRGDILDITYTQDGYAESYQCWVRTSVLTPEQAEAFNVDVIPDIHMYMLFDASDWVIEV